MADEPGGAAVRLDQALVERGLVRSRSQAQQRIAEGLVTVGGRTALKPSLKVAADAELGPLELPDPTAERPPTIRNLCDLPLNEGRHGLIAYATRDLRDMGSDKLVLAQDDRSYSCDLVEGPQCLASCSAEAVAHSAELLAGVLRKHGAEAIAGVASAHACNEDLGVLKRLLDGLGASGCVLGGMQMIWLHGTAATTGRSPPEPGRGCLRHCSPIALELADYADGAAAHPPDRRRVRPSRGARRG